MNIDVYCDETYPDLLSSQNPQANYLVIGSLWLQNQNRDAYKKAIHSLRDRYRVGGEFKWTKLTPSKVEFYKALTTWFNEQGKNLRFRCISIDRRQVNLIHFHRNDQELGFYKFYYQMIHHWIHPFNEYRIYCDYKHNRLRDRLHTLKNCLTNANLAAAITTVQSVRSSEAVLLQLSDVLVGIASARLNSRLREDSAKKEVVLHLEGLLGRRIASTPLSEKKFNVFKINLQGGW